MAGLRLCGMDDEPPLPSPAGSATSPTSLCDSSHTSVAILPRAPAVSASADASSATGVRRVCHGRTGRSSPVSSAKAATRSNARSPNASSVPAGPPSCTGSGSAARRPRASRQPSSQFAAFAPNVVGSACRPSVRAGIGVSRYRAASPASASSARSRWARTTRLVRAATSMAPVSAMSWLVAPRWTCRPAGPASARRSATSGTTGLPEPRARRARSAASKRPASAAAAPIAAAASAGMMPRRAWALARAASASSIAAR